MKKVVVKLGDFVGLSLALIGLLVVGVPELVLTEPKVNPPGQATDDKKTYAVIVDCGSSGTRAHIFGWRTDLKYPELLNHIEPMRDPSDGKPISKSIQPGLSSLKDNPDRASEYVQPLIEFILQKIPAKHIKNTRIYILATAGLRLLDEKVQTQIMDDIGEWLRKEYNFERVQTSVISGAAEGMYQWINVNSRLKRFLKNHQAKEGTYGIIEMGGASLQVTYQLRLSMAHELIDGLNKRPGAMLAFEGQLARPKLSRKVEELDYKLLSTSFLGLGSNSARKAYTDLLIMDSIRSLPGKLGSLVRAPYTRENPLYLNDPCLPPGATDEDEKPVRMLTSKTQTIGFAVDEDGEKMFAINLRGSGQYDKCRRRLSRMLKIARKERLNCKTGHSCAMTLLGTKFVPFSSYNYLGLGDFYYTTSTMELPSRYDSYSVEGRTREICTTQYTKLLEKYPKADNRRLLLQCFKGTFVDVFLTEGLGMPRYYKGLQMIGSINGESIDWTLGAALDESSGVEYYPEFEVSEEAFYVPVLAGVETAPAENRLRLPAKSPTNLASYQNYRSTA